jgi:hypothetical protein
MGIDPDIGAHYGLGFEQARLVDRLEYVRTRELLAASSPPPAGHLLATGLRAR